MYMRSLSDLEHRLLTELRSNGRAPVSQLAEKLGVTRATVTKKMEQLETEGIIVGYTVRTASDALEQGVRAISMVVVERKNSSQAIADVRGIPEVTALHTTNGHWDLVLEIACRDLPACAEGGSARAGRGGAERTRLDEQLAQRHLQLSPLPFHGA